MKESELATRIQAFLDMHQTSADVVRIDNNGGGTAKAYLVPVGNTTLAKVRRLSDDIARAIGSTGVEANNEGTNIVLSIRTKDKPESPSLDEIPPPESPYTATIGVEEMTRHPVYLNFGKSQNAHILVAGMSGFGKTMMIQTICMSLATSNRISQTGFVILDPKGNYAFAEAMSSRLLFPVSRDIESGESAIKRCVEVMNTRLKSGASSHLPHIFIVIDEAWEWNAKSDVIRAGLTEIASKGREACFHLVIGTQKPTATALESLLKANIQIRIVTKVGDAREASTATGIPNSGVEKIANPGEFLVLTPTGQIKVIGAMVELDDVAPPPALEIEETEPPALPPIIQVAEVEKWLAENEEAKEVVGRWICGRNPAITNNAIATAIWGSKNNADRQRQIDRWRSGNDASNGQ